MSAPPSASDQRVQASILEHGPSTATQLAARLGLSAAGVRRHLDVLADQGHVTSREQRIYGTRGRGRPAKVFALTDSGRADFYQAYDSLAIEALNLLVEQAGPEAVAALGRRRVAEVERRYHRLRSDSDQSPAEDLHAAHLVATSMADPALLRLLPDPGPEG